MISFQIILVIILEIMYTLLILCRVLYKHFQSLIKKHIGIIIPIFTDEHTKTGVVSPPRM